MATTTHFPRASQLGSKFDEFLFAPIADDSNGMLLSVVSALARLNVDPWEEAANLARLPMDAATQRLRALIAALPEGTPGRPDPGTIAARLIPLLPRRGNSETWRREMLRRLGAASKTRFTKFLVCYAIFIVLVVGFHWILEPYLTLAQPGNGSTPAAAFSPAPHLNSGQ